MLQLDFLLPSHNELLCKEDMPSQLIFHNNYEIWLIRTTTIDEDSLLYSTSRFIVWEEKVYRYDRESGNIIPIGDRSDLYREIEDIIHQYEYILDAYQDIIEKKEDALYMRVLSTLFLNEWFDLKRDLTRLDRILTRLTHVFSRFKKHLNQTDQWETLAELIEIQQRLASLYIARLDMIQNYVTSLKNEKMNRNLYTLTILSAIFLPLNFVIGFFGMNTQNMFLQNEPNGTLYVSLFMITIVLMLLLGLPLIMMIERRIIRKVLGKFTFYKNIANRVDNLRSDDLDHIQ